jgi:tetratricopeptide (TPR) repeat protein
VVCTETYKQRYEGKAPGGEGKGAKWEGFIITLELYEAEERNTKFIPVVLSPQDAQQIPLELRGASGYDLSAPEAYENLLRHITNQPARERSPVAPRIRDMPPVSVPMADPRRFSVALAHLTHDDRQEVERLIVESVRDVAGVQVLRFDRAISAEGPIPEESERDAHDMARALLRESSADALIWGTVLSHAGRTAPRLYWTTADSSMRSTQPYVPENFRLPELFWEDLAEVLRLLVITRSANLFARRGRNTAAELAPFVEKVRNLVERGQATQRWTAGATAQVMFILAMALEQLGEQTGERDRFTQSVRYYREIAATGSLGEDPAFQAALQNGLGVALGALGALEPDSSHLLEAVAVFQDALNRVGLRERLPPAWASLQRNLGNALLILGLHESGAEKLRQAVEAYCAAANGQGSGSRWIGRLCKTISVTPCRWPELQSPGANFYLLRSLAIAAH